MIFKCLQLFAVVCSCWGNYLDIKILLKELYYVIGGESEGSFAKELFLNVYVPPDGMKKENNPVEKTKEPTFAGYFSNRSISRLAFSIRLGLSKENLKKYLSSNITKDNLEGLAESLEEYEFTSGLAVKAENIIEIVSEELIAILKEEARKYEAKKRGKRISHDLCINTDDIDLYNETDGTCPLCYKKIRIPGSSIKGASSCRIIHLYTTRLADECGLFDSVEIPDDLNGDENRIALCERCANGYENKPTIEMYKTLKEIKKTLAGNYLMNATLNSLYLEDNIRDVLVALHSIDGDGEKIKDFGMTYEPVEVDKKITDNYVLKREMRSKVIDFFNFIKAQLSDLDANATRSDEIANDIHGAYIRLKKGGLNKNEIVNKLAEWILLKANLKDRKDEYMQPARVIVAFYIQLCQVFEDETTK